MVPQQRELLPPPVEEQPGDNPMAARSMLGEAVHAYGRTVLNTWSRFAFE
jgi:hypothetical protein